LAFQAAFLVPSAEHGSKAALLNNRALALGNALNGGKDSARLTPGVTGLQLGASLEHTQRPFDFRASIELPLLLRVSDASLPEETETHPIAILPALDLRAAWWITASFAASLGAGLITEPLVEPGLHLQLGRHVALGLDGSIPVGGNLGGDAWSIGLHARLGL
jgi:hypothetical protein